MSSTDMETLESQIKNFTHREVEFLISKFRVDYQSALDKLALEFRERMSEIVEKQQTHFMAQVTESGTALQWILVRLSGTHQRQCREVKDLLDNSQKLISLGLTAQRTLLISLIEQMTKDFDVLGRVLLEAPESVPIKQPTNAKIKCSMCETQHSDVMAYRRHYKDAHGLVFKSYTCSICNFSTKGIDEFSTHLIKMHQRKTCMCDTTFQTKQSLQEHLRFCTKFFDPSEPTSGKKLQQ